MKCVLICLAVFAAASAQDQYGQARYPSPVPINRVLSSEGAANTINYVNEVYPDGAYRHSYNTDNGISAEAQGTPKAFPGNPPVAPVVSEGSFSWVAPDGQQISIRYIADENGYQPIGDAIPTSPPIPDVILRSIEYNARYPQPQQK